MISPPYMTTCCHVTEIPYLGHVITNDNWANPTHWWRPPNVAESSRKCPHLRICLVKDFLRPIANFQASTTSQFFFYMHTCVSETFTCSRSPSLPSAHIPLQADYQGWVKYGVADATISVHSLQSFQVLKNVNFKCLFLDTFALWAVRNMKWVLCCSANTDRTLLGAAAEDAHTKPCKWMPIDSSIYLCLSNTCSAACLLRLLENVINLVPDSC